MKLSLLEYLLVNSPLRGLAQRWLEGPWFYTNRPLPTGAKVLEIGCGRGLGLDIIIKNWRASHVTGLDIDPRMLSLAAQKVQREQLDATLVSGSAEEMPFPAQHFDAVVSFGAIHHVPVWQNAIIETSRVLKPGGLAYLYEYYSPLLEKPWFTKLMPHPPRRFTHEQLIHELKRQGFTITHQTTTRSWWGMVIAQKQAPSSGSDYE